MSILDIRNLKRHFGGLVVTDDVSLTIEKGDRIALIGPNGAGKTTLVNLVTGHLKPHSGRVFIDDEDVTNASPGHRVRAGLIRSFQLTRLFSEMTAEEHVALAILQRVGKSGKLLFDYRGDPEITREAADILRLLNLNLVARVQVAEIPYGQQRLLEIALAMALRPKVLLLDEPAAGVPNADTILIERALASLPPDLAVLMIEHDMDFVFRFAQRVVVLAAGAVIFDGSPSEVAADMRVRAAYLGSYADDRSIA